MSAAPGHADLPVAAPVPCVVVVDGGPRVTHRAAGMQQTLAVKPPDVSYARSGDVAIAYQLVGDGPMDIVFLRGITGDLLSTWEQPLLVRHVEGLASSGRVFMLDKRGTGLSDRVREVQSLETTMDDIRAVMDAVGSERAVIWTGGNATGIAVLFAATYPERCAGLVLFDPRVKGVRSPDYPWTQTEDEWRRQLAEVRTRWGARDYFEELAREWARGVGRRGLRRLVRLAHAPQPEPGRRPDGHSAPPWSSTSATSSRRSAYRPSSCHGRRCPDPGHYTAARIRGSEVVELPAFRGVYTWVDDEAHPATMEATERFISRLAAPKQSERVLATILFTDIVGSTELAGRLGDTAWRELLERHHAIVRRELARFHGRELDTAGDGFFATFDGPARAVLAAAALREPLQAIGIDVRAGLHTGEFEVSDGKIVGIAVSIGARISSLAGPGEVLVSSTVKDLVAGSGLRFEDRGEHQLKGIPEAWRVFALAA